VLARDTLRIAVVGDVDPATLGQLLDKDLRRIAGQGQPDAGPRHYGRQAAAARLHSADVPQTVVTFGSPGIIASRSRFYGGLCRQPDSRRQRAVVAALSRGSREARPGLFDLWIDVVDGSLRAVSSAIPATRADRAGQTVDAIDKEVRRMAEDGPTQAETG